ncbi:hypothetical protein N9H56_00935 [Pseudomonadales bacterium]|nr:hypothetical protein [Pseudomonadales bacterium]
MMLLLAVFGDLSSDLTAAAKLSLGYFFGMFIGYALGAIIIAYPISWVVIGLGKFQSKFEPKDDD